VRDLPIDTRQSFVDRHPEGHVFRASGCSTDEGAITPRSGRGRRVRPRSCADGARPNRAHARPHPLPADTIRRVGRTLCESSTRSRYPKTTCVLRHHRDEGDPSAMFTKLRNVSDASLLQGLLERFTGSQGGLTGPTDRSTGSRTRPLELPDRGTARRPTRSPCRHARSACADRVREALHRSGGDGRVGDG
jgi:hypothetical protein